MYFLSTKDSFLLTHKSSTKKCTRFDGLPIILEPRWMKQIDGTYSITIAHLSSVSTSKIVEGAILGDQCSQIGEDSSCIIFEIDYLTR